MLCEFGSQEEIDVKFEPFLEIVGFSKAQLFFHINDDVNET